jgi:hypothetical protein
VRVFQITVRDSGDVYSSLESFRFEIESMANLYGLPADIVSIVEITRGRERGSSPTTSPGPELRILQHGLEQIAGLTEPRSRLAASLANDALAEASDFHDVAGANV